MGLLDWITEGLGNVGASASPGTMPPDMMGSPPPDAPPPVPGQDPTAPSTAAPLPTAQPPLNFQRPEFARGALQPPAGGGLPPPPQFAEGGDPMAGTGSGNNGGLPPPGGIPMPQPRPPGASMGLAPEGQPMTPAEGNRIYDSYKAAGGGGPVQIYGSSQPPDAPMGGTVPGPNGKLNDASSWIGGKLGLDSNKEKSMFGSLAEGLKAAGNSKGKSKGQAFASGAGSAIEGGNKAEDKSYDQRLKALQLAVSAQTAGDRANYNLNYAKYLSGKLKADTDKAAAGGKSGAWNKPDSQKFIDAQNALAKDPDIRASQKLLEQAAKDGDPNAVAKAKAEHDALVQQKQGLYLTGVGLNPQQIQKNMQTPPGTRDNPHQVTSQQDFDRYVKPGEVYINPRDGKPYVRKGAADGASDSAASAAPSASPEPPGLSPEQSGESDEHEQL